MESVPVVLVHGGAGDISTELVEPKKKGTVLAARKGYAVLEAGGSALDAVIVAVKSMEDDTAFNAGTGSVLNADGDVEMDAVVMEGTALKAGAVGALKRVQHPIDVARLVMDKSNHILIVGDGAKRFADEHGVPDFPNEELVTERSKLALERKKKLGGSAATEADLVRREASLVCNCTKDGVGTVGAVAVDSQGHVAVATSTGGTTGKLPGRVGDSPLLGCGSYSDDTVGAVSATGHGESIMKVCLSRQILTLLEQGKSPTEATQEACEAMTNRVGNTAGAITVSNKGEVGFAFTSDRMAWAYQQAGKVHFGVDQGEDIEIDA